jgi:hypothetical protein
MRKQNYVETKSWKNLGNVIGHRRRKRKISLENHGVLLGTRLQMCHLLVPFLQCTGSPGGATKLAGPLEDWEV